MTCCQTKRTSGDPQRSMPGSFLVNNFINYLVDGMGSTLKTCANDTYSKIVNDFVKLNKLCEINKIKK